jgi:hypothetical protein
MTTFDLAGVHEFTADIGTRMDRCDDGEGAECATLDHVLRHYAQLSCEFIEGVRRWGDAVFSGRAKFDPEVERVWKEEGWRLHARAMELLGRGQGTAGSGSILEGRQALQSALWDLDRLLRGWVAPKLAVGPSARRRLVPGQAATAEELRQVASLPPLPADWEPDEPGQRALFRKIRES